MLKQTFFATALVSATFAFAAPKAEWIPASSDVVFVGHNLQKEDKAASEAWRNAFKSIGIDFEADQQEMLNAFASNPSASTLFKALEIDLKNNTHPFESFTLAIKLPSSEDVEDFSVLATIETTKPLDLDAIATAANDMLAKADEDDRFTKDGTWYTIKEEDGTISFGNYDNAVRVVISSKVANDYDSLKNATFKAIDSTSPLSQALIAPNAYSSVKIVLKDFSALMDRYVKMSNEDRQIAEATIPMLFTTKAIALTVSTEGKNAVINLTGSYATEQDAQTCANTLTAYRFMVTAGMAPELGANSALIKAINGITIQAKDKTATIKIVLSPEEATQIISEIQASVAKAMMQGNADYEDYGEGLYLEDDYELSEEEALKILEEMNK
jgi:hypothetical protein